jgi:glycosyltransferase involved in cell wall biosynthesis
MDAIAVTSAVEANLIREPEPGATVVSGASGRPQIDIAIPVYNEEHDLEPSVRRLHGFLNENVALAARITIVDNASTDGTRFIGMRLQRELAGVRFIHLEQKGRGRALRAAWSSSDADVVAYMDVDLSTDLGALMPLVEPLLTGRCDVAIGSRLAPGAQTRRGLKREVISRCYNLLLRTLLRVRFRDAQCGFKAVSAEAARQLLPRVEDEGFFFDTELLVLAQHSNLRIHELPVAWTDDPDSRVRIIATALADLRGVARIIRGLPEWRRVKRFAAIGILSTAAYVVLYNLLRIGLSPALSNAVALLVTAVVNTAANRRITFQVTGEGHLKHQLAGLAAFVLALGITTGAVKALFWLDPGASRALEVVSLVLASAVATVLRYLMLRVAIMRRPVSRHEGTVPVAA